MPKSKKTKEERIADLDARLAKIQMQAQKIEAEKKKLKTEQKEEERKKRTKRLIEIGAAVESICGIPIEKEDIPTLLKFFYNLENKNDNYYSRYMGYNVQKLEEDGNVSFKYTKQVTSSQNQ